MTKGLPVSSEGRPAGRVDGHPGGDVAVDVVRGAGTPPVLEKLPHHLKVVDTNTSEPSAVV
eukprot:scaffold395922_cov19-Prasinocladus_malaysianus.AAC.1